MAAIKKLGPRKYEVRGDFYDDEGRRHQVERRFKTKTEADELKAKLDLGQAQAVVVRPPLFSSWIKEWFATYQVVAELEVLTICGYQKVVDRLIVAFGPLRLNQITPSRIEGLYKRMMFPAKGTDDEITKRPLSGATCVRHHAVLRKAMEYALRDGYVQYNPCDRVKKPRGDAPEITPPTADEVNELLDEQEGKVPFVAILLLAKTVARESEVLGLQWHDIDFNIHKIHYQRARVVPGQKTLENIALPKGSHVEQYGKTKYIIKDHLKSRHNRWSDMDSELEDVLRAERKRQLENRLRYGESYNDTPYVCVDDLGLPIHSKRIHDATPDGMRVHDLRHAGASIMLGENVPLPVVSKALGHTTTVTTAKVYAHAIEDQNQRAAQAISANIGKSKIRNSSHKIPHDRTKG